VNAPKKRSAPAALAVAAGILLSRIAGLVRERVFAHYLGDSDAAGAFKAAIKIPNLLQNLFGEGVLSASFIPVYARLRAEGREEDAGKVAGAVASLLTLVVSVLVALGVLLSRPLIEVIAPGFKDPEVRELTIHLVQIMFLGCGVLVLSAWCLGVLNSHKKFFLSYVAPVLWNIAQIATLFFFGARVGSGRAAQMELATEVAWATVVGAGLQLLVQLPTAIALVRSLRPSLDVRADATRTVLRNFAPVVLSRGVVQLSAYIDQVLVSYLGTAATANLGYAQTIYLLPIALFGMAISAAELPEMSSAIGTPEEVAAKLRGRLSAGLRRIVFFVVPSVVAFLVLGDVVVAMLYQTGQFGHDQTLYVWTILAGSTVGMLAATQARLLSSAFYALHDTRTPLRFAIVRVILTGATGYAVALPLRVHFGWPAVYGTAGLTATAGIAGWIEFLLLRRALAKKIGAFSIGGRAIGVAWAAALVAGGAAFAVHRVFPLRHPVVGGVIVLGVYGVLYFAGTMLGGLDEARALLRRIRR
jgi:putative peptidoglycan lipid II flippase